MHIDPTILAEQQRIAARMASLGLTLPGTLLHRYARCGKSRCRCHADPPTLHGPWWSWTRKVNGKTITTRLTDDQVADYQPWLDNARDLRELTTALERLALQAIERDPR